MDSTDSDLEADPTNAAIAQPLSPLCPKCQRIFEGFLDFPWLRRGSFAIETGSFDQHKYLHHGSQEKFYAAKEDGCSLCKLLWEACESTMRENMDQGNRKITQIEYWYGSFWDKPGETPSETVHLDIHLPCSPWELSFTLTPVEGTFFNCAIRS